MIKWSKKMDEPFNPMNRAIQGELKRAGLSLITGSSTVIFAIVGIQGLVSAKTLQIHADCPGGRKVTLEITTKRVERRNTVSAVNLDSKLRTSWNKTSIRGSTSVFYGGQSNYFTSYDNKISFDVTQGFGESKQISEAVLTTSAGRFSCVIRR